MRALSRLLTIALAFAILLIPSLSRAQCLSAAIEGPYDVPSWLSTGIPGGATAVTPAVNLSYDLNLGFPGPGVPPSTGTFLLTPRDTGTLTFNWKYTGNHSFVQARTGLQLRIQQPGGGATGRILVPQNTIVANDFAFSGTTSMAVTVGVPLQVIVAGSNQDGNSQIRGEIVLSEFNLQPVGAADLSNWSTSGMLGGTMSVDRALASSYAVNLGQPGLGVPARTAVYFNVADRSGTVTFNWRYQGFHAFFNARASLQAFANTPHGYNLIDLVAPGTLVSGPFLFSGSVTLDVQKGAFFGIIVGGENSDSDSQLTGSVTLSRFDAPARGFIGPWHVSQWASSELIGPPPDSHGYTTIQGFDPALTLDLGFVLSPAGPTPGDDLWQANWSLPNPPTTGDVAFSWAISGTHSGLPSHVGLQLRVDRPDGIPQVITLVPSTLVHGGFSFGETTMAHVVSGYPITLELSGPVSDASGNFVGTLRLSSWDAPRCPGDTDCDFAVGLTDIAAVIENWGRATAIGASGDVNDDAFVNLSDIAIVIQSWGATCP